MTQTSAEKDLAGACAVDCSRPDVQARLRQFGATYRAALDDWTSQVHREIDAYVLQAVNPKRNDLDRERVARGIDAILEPVGLSEGLEPTPVFLVGSGEARSLVVVYALSKCGSMGSGGTSVTLRAFRAINGQTRLSDVTGESMDGHALQVVKQLHSPNSEQLLLLLSGQMSGANGPNIGMRVFMFDGMKFRTLWMPENVWGGFTIAVTPSGFTVKGHYYNENRTRDDAYFVSPDGVSRIPPR